MGGFSHPKRRDPTFVAIILGSGGYSGYMGTSRRTQSKEWVFSGQLAKFGRSNSQIFTSVLRLTKSTQPVVQTPSELESLLREIVVPYDAKAADQSGQLAWAIKAVEALHSAGYLTLKSDSPDAAENLKQEFSAFCRGRASETMADVLPDIFASSYSE